MASVGSADLTVIGGGTFDEVLTYAVDGVPIDLSGYTAALQVRSAAESDDVLLELTTEGDPTARAIVLGGAAGTIRLFMSAAETAALAFTGGAYGLSITSPYRVVTPLLIGTFTVVPGVVRA